ncbi:MAG: hypothetical protein ACREEK_30115 [Bradyrhizobium sp.]
MAQESRSLTRQAAKVNAAPRSRIFIVRAAMIVMLCVAQAPIARADPASCIEKVSSYVAELDQLLSKERNWITPFDDLNDRYFPFQDCDTDALLEIVWAARFRRSITYNPRVKEYLILFSSNDVRVGFSYRALERKSNPPFVVWVDK